MITIAQATQDILSRSDVATQALAQGILNASAYAKDIRHEVETMTQKEVKVATIVAALLRMRSKVEVQTHEVRVHIEAMAVQSPLVELVYERSQTLTLELEQFERKAAGGTGMKDFYTITHGTSETVVIATETRAWQLKQQLSIPPLQTMTKLVSVSVRFSGDYIDQPNVFYSLIRPVALKRINIIELVSTYSELTLIIDEQDLVAVMESIRSAHGGYY
ncbi:MAG: hypothetical protein NUV52_01990 [Candidatus Roizmanbacteria bacterium]|nr:hypothetical protein [Candidatus Roizmanbacteria bacterium]